MAENIIVTDDTLGAETSQRDPIDATTDFIRGGADRDSNLFHSFSEFNISETGQVYFESLDGIENIFSRVTGSNPSNILGTLGVDGTANLFLINPNGISFGENASLDIEGSFFATTADAIQLDDQGLFSATEPESSALLTVQPSAFLFSQAVSQPISSIQNRGTLAVQPNQSLFLVGGEILLDGGQLNAPDGRIEVASIAAGTADISFSGGFPNLTISDSASRTDAVLTNGSQIDVLGTGLGSIAIHSNNLEIAEASKLLAGISTTPSSPVGQAGNVAINTVDSLVLTGAIRRSGFWDRSAISNATSSTVVGNSGDIDISTRSLEITRGAEINTNVGGQGTAGDITINAAESVNIIRGEVYVQLDNEGNERTSFAESRIRSGVAGSATNAQGGNLEINTGNLRVADGAYVTATSNGEGDAGSVTINAQNVEFSNTRDPIFAAVQNFPSGAYSWFTGRGSNRQAGSITVNVGSLSLIDGGILAVNNTSAEPGDMRNAGTITINAGTVQFLGEWVRDSGLMHSGAYARVESGGVGNSGNIFIITEQFEAKNGGLISTSLTGRGSAGNILLEAQDIEFSGVGRTDIASGAYSRVFGSGNGQAGNISIRANSLELRDGGVLLTTNSSSEPGELRNAGDIEIEAQQIFFQGESTNPNDWMHSGAYSRIEPGGVGNSGNISIRSEILQLADGSIITSSVRGQGNAGTVQIESPEIQVSGISPTGLLSSGIYSRVTSIGSGRGGNIMIDTSDLDVKDGAVISTNTLNDGDAGDITINAENVALDGRGELNSRTQDSGIFSQVEISGEGRGGEVNLNTHTLSVTGGADINTGISGGGEAGSISINASGPVVINTGSIDSRIEGSGRAVRAGTISINAESLDIIGTSGISTSAFGSETVSTGNITIDVQDYILIDGPGGGIFSQIGASPEGTRTNSLGNSGSITIRTGRLELRGTQSDGSSEDRSGITTRSTRGNAGEIRIEAQDIVLTNAGIIRADFAGEGEGRGGDVNILTNSLSLTNGAQILTSFLERTSDLPLTSPSSELSRAGNVNIQAEQVSISTNASIETETSGRGRAGDINLRVTGPVVMVGAETGSVEEATRIALGVQPDGSGPGGNLLIQADSLTMADGARIATSTQGQGDAGSVGIEARTVDISGRTPNSGFLSGIFATTDTTAEAGSITVLGDILQLSRGAALSTRTQGTGQGGNISISARERFTARDGTIETVALFSSGGNIDISAGRASLFGNSDIETFVSQGEGQGGNITITADAILAFGNSDILAFAPEGQGGNITLNTSAFFGENYQPSSEGIDLFSLDENLRVDVNATGSVSGVVTIPDVSFIQNSLTELPETVVTTEQLIAGSCIARTDDGSSFIISGSGGLPERPSTTFMTPYPTGEIRPLGDENSAGDPEDANTWQPGDPMVEPQGLFQLPDGRLIATHECVFE
jgi:filamentous hemagglutinin family protein